MGNLELYLLGPFQARLDGTTVGGFRSDKTRALLAYLAVESDKPHRRDWLASLLWGDYEDRAARRSLTTTLANLRQILSPLAAPDGSLPVLQADQQSVTLVPGDSIWIDVVAFRNLIDDTTRHPHRSLVNCSQCIARLEQATALYQGDFLTGFTVDDSPPFDEWRRVQAEALHQQALAALDTLARHYAQNKRYAEAQNAARRQLALEPWREVAHRQLMATLAAMGQRTAALAQFDICRNILADELGSKPEQETLDLVERIRAGESTELSPRFPAENPYKGLQAFREQDEADFFGRDDVARRLCDLTLRYRLVTVIGSSGSGKTSVARAGLVPLLEQGLPPDGNGKDQAIEGHGPTPPGTWLILSLRPGRQPFQALAAALAPALAVHPGTARLAIPTPPGELALALRQGRVTLADVSRSLIAGSASGHRQQVLLMIDQFEEIFSLCEDEATRQAFMDLLTSSTATPGKMVPPLTLLLLLRADFMEQVLEYRPLADALQTGSLVLGPMNRAELEQAIVRPAEAQGVHFQDGLVTRILDDVGESQGRLPLLEFALTQLWQTQEDGSLNHAGYEAIGRVEGALAMYAEQQYGLLSDSEQAAIRRVLVQMVQPGEGTEDTRRPATRAELGEEDWQLAQKLANARLLVTGLDNNGLETAEIVHEALIRSWSRLRGWLDSDRAFRTWQQRVRSASQQWELSDRDPGALLRGTLLAEAETWAAARPDELSGKTREFLAASQAQRDADRLAAEEQQVRELAQARALAESEAKASRRFRWLATALAVLAAAAFVASLVAIFRGLEADAQRDRALSRQLAAQALTLQDKKPDLALLLSLEASRFADQPDDQANPLLNLEFSPYLSAFLHGHEGAIYALAISPDGKILASGSDTGGVYLWDLPARRLQGEVLTPQESLGEVYQLAFSPDGNILATGYRKGEIILWDVATRQPSVEILRGHSDVISSLVFSADGQTLASGSDDGTLRQWKVETGEALGSPLIVAPGEMVTVSPDQQSVVAMEEEGSDTEIILYDASTGEVLADGMDAHREHINDLAFSPDGQTLASSGFDKIIMLWDMASGKSILSPLAGHEARVLQSAFSPDGKTLASGSTDGTVRLWNVGTGQPISDPMTGHGNWVRTLTFTPDGQWLISGGNDGTIILWHTAIHRQLPGHTAQVRGLAFTPDGNTLASGSFDTMVRRWDVASGELSNPPLAGHTNSVLNVAISPDGTTIASGSADKGHIRLWDVATGQPMGEPLAGHDGPVVALAFHPDGNLLVSGGFDNTIVLWDMTAQPPKPSRLAELRNWVLAAAFSPDGKILATGSADGAVRLWDVATRTALGEPLEGHTNWVTSVAFSPDGQTLASGSSDSTILLWDVASQRRRGQPLTGHQGPVWAVHFNPTDDGHTLISADNTGVVRRWLVATGLPASLPLKTGVEIESMALHPGGNLIAMGAFDSSGLVHLWELSDQPWPELACQIANRNLSQEEWNKYLDDQPYHETCTRSSP